MRKSGERTAMRMLPMMFAESDAGASAGAEAPADAANGDAPTGSTTTGGSPWVPADKNHPHDACQEWK